MIQHAKISEIPDILAMTDACRHYMDSQGIYQWTDDYPSENQFKVDIEKEELYTLRQGSVLVGCIVISSFMDEEYKTVKWLTTNGKNIYIHRLGVHPICQGKGYAQQLMTFAEDYARKNNFTSVRLDTFSKNQRNQRFYEQRGYQKLENIYFLKQSEYPFHCYELVL